MIRLELTEYVVLEMLLWTWETPLGNEVAKEVHKGRHLFICLDNSVIGVILRSVFRKFCTFLKLNIKLQP